MISAIRNCAYTMTWRKYTEMVNDGCLCKGYGMLVFFITFLPSENDYKLLL